MRIFLVGILSLTLIGCSCPAGRHVVLDACTSKPCFKPNRTTTKTDSQNATKTAKTASVAAKATKPNSPQTSNGSDKEKIASPITTTRDSSAPPPQAVESAKSIVETNLSVATSSQASEASDPVLEKAKTVVASKTENPAPVEFEDMVRAIRKPAESKSMMHIAVGFLLVVIFCIALTFIRQTKNHNKKGSIRQLSVELDALKVEVDGLKRILEATAKTTEPWSVIPSTTSDVALEDTALGGGNGQSIQGDNPSLDEPVTTAPTLVQIVPTQPPTSADTWARDEGAYAAPQLPAMADVHQITYQDNVVCPACPKCRNPMLLKRIEAKWSNYYNGKFECETCDRTKPQAIKLARSPKITPD